MSSDYVCKKCGVSGKKLWRPYMLAFEDLMCMKCIPDVIHPDILEKVLDGGDQCGWWVAAVPYKNGGFWGYNAVPANLADWWRNLPL